MIKRSKVKRSKVTRGQRSGSKVKVTINVKEKAGGLNKTKRKGQLKYYSMQKHNKDEKKLLGAILFQLKMLIRKKNINIISQIYW